MKSQAEKGRDGRYESGRGGCEASGADEVDADGVETGKAVASGSVGFGGRLGESGKEAGVAVGRPSSIFEGVKVCMRRGTRASAERGRFARLPW